MHGDEKCTNFKTMLHRHGEAPTDELKQCFSTFFSL